MNHQLVLAKFASLTTVIITLFKNMQTNVNWVADGYTSIASNLSPVFAYNATHRQIQFALITNFQHGKTSSP